MLRVAASVFAVAVSVPALAAATPAFALPQAEASSNAPATTGVEGVTAVPGISAGHFAYAEAPTGCTVVLADDRAGATGGVDVRGGAPGTVETDLLDPVNTVDALNAVVLSGGSAFGLAARQGVVRYLEEQGRGYRIGPELVVPIVAGAVVFDLRVSEGVRPGPECGYRAASRASRQPLAEGSEGAGAGATVGKLLGMTRAMKGGVGTASARLPGGLVVGAVVVVNAVGDVIDPASGQVVAGARDGDGGLADARRIIRGAATPPSPSEPSLQNTTIGVVATNAALTKPQATKVAQMAQDGLARTIYPSHTPRDGDAIFTLATGRLASGFDTGQVGALAAEVVAEAVLRAVRAARGLPGLPAAADLRDLPGR